jgi:hypothetical protein
MSSLWWSQMWHIEMEKVNSPVEAYMLKQLEQWHFFLAQDHMSGE